MKKLLSFACVCAACATVTADPTEVTCGNAVGMLTISSTNADTIVAVPFGELATGESVCASNLVKTANLSKGDDLFVYNQSTKKWLAWELAKSEGTPSYLYWKSIGEVSFNAKGELVQDTMGSPSTTYLAAGSAIWLKRQSPVENGNAKPFYVYGSYTNTLATVVTANVNNLVANPTENEMEIVGAETDDQVRRVVSEQQVKQYNKIAEGWRWTDFVDNKIVFRTNSVLKLPAGQGVWYKPKTTRTITWRSAPSK